MATAALATPAAAPRGATERIPLTTLAAPFGLGGLAEAWTAGAQELHLSPAIAWALWAATALVWVWLIAAHVARGIRTGLALRPQLMHPAQGPIAALVPTTGLLLSARLHTITPVGGRVLLFVSMAAALWFAGWLISGWLGGRLALENIHGGYLLPTVAAGFVAGTASTDNGFPALGWAAFAVAAFFTFVMTALIVLRLAIAAPLPAPLVPSMAILAAPPAVGALTWFALNGEHADPVAIGFAGMLVLLLAVQAGLLPRYLKLRFSLGFWSFTFTAGAIVTDAIIWLGILHVAGAVAITAVLLAAVTVLIGGIGIRSLMLLRG